MEKPQHKRPETIEDDANATLWSFAISIQNTAAAFEERREKEREKERERERERGGEGEREAAALHSLLTCSNAKFL
jgi:hypothetical protein